SRRGQVPRRRDRARGHAPLRGLGRQARRNPASPGARPPHRAAEGRPHGVSRSLYGGPGRLPPPGRRRRPGTVTAVQGIFTAEEMRRLDARAIAELGMSGATLMENAGRGAAEAIWALLEDLKARSGARVVIVCGKGGNGGDGFVVARWLRKWGARVEVLLAFPEDEIRGDAGEKLRELKRSGVRPWLVEDLEAAEETLARADVIVDALLGTGSRGAPEGRVARLIELINASGRPVVAPHFPPRPRDAHKGSYGHLLVVAGSLGKTGAAALAATAALRAGVGLVTVATPASQQPVVAGLVLEAMTEPLPETGARTLALKAREVVPEPAAARDGLAPGPAIGLDEETGAATRALTAEVTKPIVIDADGLSALAGHLDVLRSAPAARCLTPHPGEMARLLGGSVADVQRDRL